MRTGMKDPHTASMEEPEPPTGVRTYVEHPPGSSLLRNLKDDKTLIFIPGERWKGEHASAPGGYAGAVAARWAGGRENEGDR